MSEPSAKRSRVQRELLSDGSCTRGALVSCLQKLQSAGLLKGDLGKGSRSAARREAQSAIEEHALADTPYGRVVQRLDLGTPALCQWEYVNPFAYLYHLTRMSKGFSELMTATLGSAQGPLRIVLYIDEVNPGNPLRPDKGRSTQSIYWCFADWPQWALQRAGVWLLFGVVRSSLVSELQAGESGLMRHVMKIFFAEHGHSFSRGSLINTASGQSLLQASFGGFLADEKAHKEILLAKGASGTKPCITCKNVVRHIDPVHRSDYLQGLDCVSYEKLDYNSNADVFLMADRLVAAKAGGMSKKDFAQLQLIFGLSYNEHGLLFDPSSRSVLLPVDNCLRDWMHALVSGGVASTEIALLLHALRAEGVTLEMIQRFAVTFTLPKARGKVQQSWFSDQRLNDDTVRSFASEQLSMVPILECFLSRVVKPLGMLPDHVKCFSLLRRLLEMLCLGPHDAIPYTAAIRDVILEHNHLFCRVYPDSIKPKFHHLLHIPDNMRTLGVLLSCFVTERKHRAVKKAACHVFRHFEHTVLADLINSQVEQFQEGNVERSFLIEPKQVAAPGETLLTAVAAALPCGEIRAGDICCLAGRRLGKVMAFWRRSEPKSDIAIEIDLFAHDGGEDATLWRSTTAARAFVAEQELIAAVPWAPQGDAAIRAILPDRWR